MDLNKSNTLTLSLQDIMTIHKIISVWTNKDFEIDELLKKNDLNELDEKLVGILESEGIL